MTEKTGRDALPVVASALAWSGMGATAVAAAVALRLLDTVSFPLGWLAAWGPVAVVVGVTAASLRILWPPPRAVLSLVVTGVVVVGPLAVFAELLKRASHHRPLGAATFAVLGAVFVLLALAIAGRLIQSAASEGRRAVAARVVLRVAIAASVLLNGVLLVTALQDRSSGALGWGLLDGALMLAAAIGAARAPGWKWAKHPQHSLLLWAVLVLGSLLALSLSPAARIGLSTQSPVVLPLAGWLGG